MLVSIFKVMEWGDRNISMYLNQNHIYHLQNSGLEVRDEDVNISWFVPLRGTWQPQPSNYDALVCVTTQQRVLCPGRLFCCRAACCVPSVKRQKRVMSKGTVWKSKVALLELRGKAELSTFLESLFLRYFRCLPKTKQNEKTNNAPPKDKTKSPTKYKQNKQTHKLLILTNGDLRFGPFILRVSNLSPRLWSTVFHL